MDKFASHDLFNSSKGMNFDEFQKLQNKMLGLGVDADDDSDDNVGLFNPQEMASKMK